MEAYLLETLVSTCWRRGGETYWTLDAAEQAAKQKSVLEATGLARTNLSALVNWSAVVVDDHKAEAIVRAVKHVTSRWAQQRKAEERKASRAANRRAALIRSRTMSVKDAAWEVMAEAYLKASSGGTLPAKTRQIYYAARGKILAMTGREKLGQQCFSQTLVPDYMESKSDATWIVFGAIPFRQAQRQLTDVLCGEYEVPLLVLHDFDKSGFSILGTLQRDTQRYEFQNEFPVIDLGLRLDDVSDWGLESEHVAYGISKSGEPKDPVPNLRVNGATEEEIDFLCGDFRQTIGYIGRRVELNAFTSGDLVEWLEGKLDEHGVKKVVPDDDTLTIAYRRSLEIAIVRKRLSETTDAAHKQAQEAAVPESLRAVVQKRLAADPTKSWDAIVAGLATEAEKQ